MLETKLSTCANLLYQWLMPRTAAGGKFKIDLQDFQAWAAEYKEKAFSDREIFDAIRQLKELQLITISKTEITLEVKDQDILTINAQLSNQVFLGQSDRPNRFVLLLEILTGSFLLGLTSISLGLALLQTQPQILTTPNQWSVLGEKPIESGN